MPAIAIKLTLGAGIAVIASVGYSVAQDRDLRPPESFAAGDPATRSKALFSEAAKVITSGRCMNCHPASDHPLQGDDHHVHFPPALRGEANSGVPGLVCGTCHTERNVTLTAGPASYQSIPGRSGWALAPINMAWEGKTIGDICRQLKDPNLNGGRSLALLQEHFAKNDLVSWAWNPGVGRSPAPGTQEQLGKLIQAWIDTGAQCP
jgi:hypothetical protein